MHARAKEVDEECSLSQTDRWAHRQQHMKAQLFWLDTQNPECPSPVPSLSFSHAKQGPAVSYTRPESDRRSRDRGNTQNRAVWSDNTATQKKEDSQPWIGGGCMPVCLYVCVSMSRVA
mmetsp:Transcript_32100/g.92846  ORF Transcript_32100/g.92846 Transcript_32100/m.92846 type:complete len:118 (+) Transcript_32100:140-493(+)